MKKIQVELYEKGDHVMVTTGYNKGKVGTVLKHTSVDNNVIYELAGSTYGEDADIGNYDEDDDYYWGDYEDSPTKHLKHITKTEYETALKNLKILTVPGLPVGVRFQGTSLIIGDNVIKPAHAKKLAEFIAQHTKSKKKKK